jgi:exonuclease SbcC
VIPRRLKLRNFLSYQECELDFMGLHVAVLAGRNGEGKSALLDAMTYAIWDRARGDKADDRIRQGAQDVLVDFEFEVNGEVYEVVRKRTRGRPTGQLDFFHHSELGKSAVTGGTMTETQQEITRRVGMDYDTFVNSAFLAQGRANEFTNKTPAERKVVFRKILGLERYEALAKEALERQKEASRALRTLETAAAENEERVARLPAVEQVIEDLNASLERLDGCLRTVDTEAAELGALASANDRLKRALADAKARYDRVIEAMRAATARRDEAEARVAAAQETVANADAISERHAALECARREERRLAALREQVADHERAAHRAEQDITSERSRLVTLAEGLDEEIQGLLAAERRLTELEAEREALGRARQELEELGTAIDAGARAVDAAREALTEARTRYDTHRARGSELQEKRKQITALQASGGTVPCPACRQPLSPADIDHVLAGYSSDIAAARQAFEEAKADQGRAQAAVEEATAKQATLTMRHKELSSLIATGQQQLALKRQEGEAAAQRRPGCEQQLAGLRTALESQSFAGEARARLHAAREAILTLGFDAAAARAATEAVERLSPAEAEYRQLAAAAEKMELLLRQRDDAASECERLAEDVRVADEGVRIAERDLEGAEDVGPRLREVQARQAELRDEEGQARESLGRARQERQQLQELAARLEIDKERARGHREEHETYGELAKAFGKDGVQAMIIDQALPRLELVANDLLDRLTNRRIQVQLDTQRQTQANKLRETLDIWVSDEAGRRDYEMYSGGEAFRVDFALRIALAKLLAERAGAGLPTLIIDEGFGSQDREGIERLVEAINHISGEFRLIIVVTHVEELRDQFERRIEVRKDPARGSLARVV